MKNQKENIAVAVILSLCMAFCLICKPVYYRLYPFDRIRGDIQVIVDGQTYALREESFMDCRKVKPNDDGSANIKIKAGKYGRYSFELYVDAIQQPVTIRCIQHNWWNVMDFDLQVDIDTNQNTVLFDGSVITIADNGTKIQDTFCYEQELTEEIGIGFGL